MHGQPDLPEPILAFLEDFDSPRVYPRTLPDGTVEAVVLPPESDRGEKIWLVSLDPDGSLTAHTEGILNEPPLQLHGKARIPVPGTKSTYVFDAQGNPEPVNGSYLGQEFLRRVERDADSFDDKSVWVLNGATPAGTDGWQDALVVSETEITRYVGHPDDGVNPPNTVLKYRLGKVDEGDDIHVSDDQGADLS